MSVFFPIATFYAVLLGLALWGAWLGWTRSKSPTARAFTVAMALVWAGFTATDAWHAYNLFRDTGLAEVVRGDYGRPLHGSFDTCSFCYEGPAGRVFVLAASELVGGHYAFTEDAHYALRFESGDVRLDGRRLEPGCYEGEAKTGTSVVIDVARGFRLEVGEAARCG